MMGRILAALALALVASLAACVERSAAPVDVAPTEPAPPPSEPEPEPVPVDVKPEPGLSAGTSRICEPVVFGECPTGTSHPGVDETLAATKSGVVTIVGAIQETETRCTRSVPPSCMSSLALRDRVGGPGKTLPLQGPPGGPEYACHESGGSPGCCTLATDGTRHAVTGTLVDRGGVPTLEVDSVCRLR